MGLAVGPDDCGGPGDECEYQACCTSRAGGAEETADDGACGADRDHAAEEQPEGVSTPSQVA